MFCSTAKCTFRHYFRFLHILKANGMHAQNKRWILAATHTHTHTLLYQSSKRFAKSSPKFRLLPFFPRVILQWAPSSSQFRIPFEKGGELGGGRGRRGPGVIALRPCHLFCIFAFKFNPKKQLKEGKDFSAFPSMVKQTLDWWEVGSCDETTPD